MFWLLLSLFVVSESKSLAASTCGAIPAGSSMMRNNQTVVFQDPMITGKCELDTNNEGHTMGREFNCSGSTAYENLYHGNGHEDPTCMGAADEANPITVKGSCESSIMCAGFDDYQYDTGDCTGKPMQNYTNEYIYWNPNMCQYNRTQNCTSDGMPQTYYFDNDRMSLYNLCTVFVYAKRRCLRYVN